jgi:hypothetical protein
MSARKSKTQPAASNRTTKKANAKKEPAATRAAAKEAGPTQKLSALCAAARVLQETGEAMTCPALIEAMKAKGYWTSPGGQTPSATLHSALMREITQKGKDARFQKIGRGLFAHTGVV